MKRPVVEEEALVGALTGQPMLVEKEKVCEPSVLSLSSVPSTILQGDKYLCLQHSKEKIVGTTSLRV